MDPNLIISNVKQLTVKVIGVYLIIRLRSYSIIIILLSIIHGCPITKVLLNETLVEPSHVLPLLWNVSILSKLLALISLISVTLLVLADVIKYSVYVEPVTRAESDGVSKVVTEFHVFNQ